MAGPLIGDAQGGADAIELGEADGAVHLPLEQGLKGMGRGVGMGLAIGHNPVLDGLRHQPGMAMALLLKDGVPIGDKAGLPAKGGGPRDGCIGPVARDIPGQAGHHVRDHHPFGRASIIKPIRHRTHPPIQTLQARPRKYTRS